jgi:short-subunit dehydrogenase
MTREFSAQVVVITGASSGIGRATALEFADRGARLVVAARRERPLKKLAQECERRGAMAISVDCDVSDRKQIEELTRIAEEQFGHIDVWVNNAAVTSYGRFDEAPLEAHERVLQVNLFGYLYGSYAAIRRFRRQGWGTLINVGSMLSRMSQPYVAPYVMSKHAVRGLGMSLQQELYVTGERNVHVCTVMPASIDTPLFQHAANYSGRKVKAMKPVYSAQKVASTIVGLVENPEYEVFVGNAARAMDGFNKLSPAKAMERLAVMTDRQHLDPKKHVPITDGNLFEPMKRGTEVSGGWKRGGLGSAVASLATLAAVAAPILFLRRGNRIQQERRAA